MSAPQSCSACAAPKASLVCGLCNKPICKACVRYLGAEDFAFMTKIPAKLKVDAYCPLCFEEHVAPDKARYEELVEKANDVYFLTKAYPGYVHVLQQHTKRVSVKVCDDRRETILRLAFMAAELGFNAIIKAEVSSAKSYKGRYQTSVWSGSALPANIDGGQLERSSLRRL